MIYLLFLHFVLFTILFLWRSLELEMSRQIEQMSLPYRNCDFVIESMIYFKIACNMESVNCELELEMDL